MSRRLASLVLVTVFLIVLVGAADDKRKKSTHRKKSNTFVLKPEIAEEIANYDPFPGQNYEERVRIPEDEKIAKRTSAKYLADVSGSQGSVMFRRRRDAPRKERVAIKHVTNKMSLKCIVDEIAALEIVTNNQVLYCVRLIGVYRGKDVKKPEVYVVMNFLDFNSLYSYIEEQMPEHSEKQIAINFARLIAVLWYLHGAS